jgi:hypothetical protein
VQRQATSRFTAIYDGEVMTDNGAKVTVYLTRLDHSAEAAMTAGIEPGVVEFALAPRPLTYLNQLHQQVSSQQVSLKQDGINVVTWGPDFITGRENVTVQNLTPAKEAALDKLFGGTNLTFNNTTQSYTAIAVQGRADDTIPWNGGDFDIELNTSDEVTGLCTTGYGAHSGSTEYLLTAGHCASVGQLAANGGPAIADDTTATEMGENTSIGSFTKPDGIDAGLINTTDDGGSSIAVYTGSSTATQVDDVSGSLSSPAGDQVCSDGAFEGEICDLVIQKSSPMPECITESESSSGPTYTVCDIYEAVNPSGGIAVGNGDSGGPVFRFSGSELEATGIITAQATATEKVCPTQYAGLSTRYCSPDLFYTSISSVLGEFGLTLNT